MGVHAAGTAAGWGQGLPGGPQLPPHHATTVTAPPGVQAAPPPPPPPAQMMAYPMQQFQVTITFPSLFPTNVIRTLLHITLIRFHVCMYLALRVLASIIASRSIRWEILDLKVLEYNLVNVL